MYNIIQNIFLWQNFNWIVLLDLNISCHKVVKQNMFYPVSKAKTCLAPSTHPTHTLLTGMPNLKPSPAALPADKQ